MIFRWPAFILEEIGGTLLLFIRALTRRCSALSVAAQLWELLVRTLPLSLVTMSFVGGVVVVHVTQIVERLFGEPGGMGPVILQFMVRGFAPAFTGVIAATRIGSGIAAELAAMSATEQLDALRLSSADPVAELVTPRLYASFFALLVLGALSILAAVYSGALAGYLAFGSRPEAFLDTQLLTGADLMVTAIKCATFGLAIPILSARAGLRNRGGAMAVGEATTQAVVTSIVAVVGLDLAVGSVALLLGV